MHRRGKDGRYIPIHSDTDTRLFNIWLSMKQRCEDQNSNNYCRYGGRGISVCEEWKTDYLAFKRWAEANGYSDKLTIDRIDVNGNYTPENCRWSTQKEQQRNRRNNIFLTVQCETHCLSEWAELTGIPYERLYYRVTHGVDSNHILDLCDRRFK